MKFLLWLAASRSVAIVTVSDFARFTNSVRGR